MPNHHHIALELKSGNDVTATFTCSAPDDGRCQAPGYCRYVEFLDAYGFWWESYEGEDVKPHDGPIVLTWHGDYYTWEYAD